MEENVIVREAKDDTEPTTETVSELEPVSVILRVDVAPRLEDTDGLGSCVRDCVSDGGDVTELSAVIDTELVCVTALDFVREM